MFGLFKIKNGGFIIRSYQPDEVDEQGNIKTVDYPLCIVNPSRALHIQGVNTVFTIFQANKDLLMPTSNIVRCVGINNIDGEDFECFDSLSEITEFIEKNKIAPYAWKNALNSSKYSFESYKTYLKKPLIKVQDNEISNMLFGGNSVG